MEPRKTSKANLENKRSLFFQTGIIIALAAVLVAFEWKAYEKPDKTIDAGPKRTVPEEIIQATTHEKEELPEPPSSATDFEIVENEVEVTDKIFVDAGASEDTRVQKYEPEMQEEEEKEEPVRFIAVQEKPSFPGGDMALLRYISRHMDYPQQARELGIEGTVYVQFVIGKDGSVTNVTVLRGIGHGCNKEAVRVIKSLPEWNPGKQRGKPVPVSFKMPVRFELQ